jgi:membrane protein implicated in regulation of membrane protease activity
MPWWGWILAGALLLGSELFVTTEFYLVFLGFAALVVGLFLLAGFDQPVWAQWLSFAVLAALFLVGFRRRVWQKIGSSGVPVRDRVVGEIAKVSERIEPGQEGRAELRGTVWTVRNVGEVPLEPGQRARAEDLEGLVLLVRPES